MKNKFFTILGALGVALVLELVLLFVSCQTTSDKTTPMVSDSDISESGTLSSLLRGATAKIQRWDEGNERERDVTVYAFKPEITLDALIQAVKDSGFYQVWSGEYTRDWDLQRGVLRWCVPADTEKWDREIQVSAIGETTVRTYGFKPIPDSGVYWTAVEDSPFKDRINGIAYGGGRFVAGGAYEDGGIWKGEMAYSADGVIWTVGDSTFSGTIVYGGGKFIIGGGYNDGRSWHCGMAYSDDGVTWTKVKDSAFGSGDDINTIAYGGGRFVAGGNEDEKRNWSPEMAYSDDGVTWTKVKYIYSTPRSGIRAIAYGAGRFVAVGGKGQFAYSADGVTWTVGEDINLGGNVHAIACGGGRFVAVGWGGKIAYSNMQE